MVDWNALEGEVCAIRLAANEMHHTECPTSDLLNLVIPLHHLPYNLFLNLI